MGALLAITFKDLRQRLRDRSAILLAVVAPFALAAVLSLVSGSVDLDARYLVVDQDGGPIAKAFSETALSELSADGLASTRMMASWDAAVQEVDGGGADAAFLLPRGLSDSTRTSDPATIEVVTSEQESYETLLAGAIARRFVNGVDSVRVARAATTGSNAPGPSVGGPPQGPVGAVDDAVELRQLGFDTYIVAGMAAFFVFFTVQFGLVSFQSERRDGTLMRMRAAPIRPSAILAGKALVALVLAMVSVTVVILASIPLLDTSWGSPPGVALLVVALSIAAVGVMAAATVVVRTYDQANGLGNVIAVVLGLLGGSFFPVFLGPELLQDLAVIAPHTWWLRGLGDLAPSDARAVDALPAATVLIAFGLGFGTFAAVRARKMLAP